MPALANARYERFANEIANGVPPRKAYPNAGFKFNPGNCYRLMRDESVLKRVEEIQTERAQIHNEGVKNAVKKMEITVEHLIGGAEAARRLAMQTEQPAAAVTALKEIGVLTGLRVERQMVKAQHQHEVNVSESSDGELREMIAEQILHWVASFGLDPDQCTVSEFLLKWEEEDKARMARDVTPEPHRRAPPPKPTRYIPRPVRDKPPPSGSYGAPADAHSYDNRRPR
jgi:hypothetical protein